MLLIAPFADLHYLCYWPPNVYLNVTVEEKLSSPEYQTRPSLVQYVPNDSYSKEIDIIYIPFLVGSAIFLF